MSQGAHDGLSAAPRGRCSQKKEGDGRRCCALFKSSRHLPRGGAKIPKTPPLGCLPSSPERPAPEKSGIRNNQNKEQKVMSQGTHVGLAAAPQGRCSQKKEGDGRRCCALFNPRATSPGVFTFFSGAFCFLVVYHYQQPNKKKGMSQGASSQTIKPRTLKTHKGRND